MFKKFEKLTIINFYSNISRITFLQEFNFFQLAFFSLQDFLLKCARIYKLLKMPL